MFYYSHLIFYLHFISFIQKFFFFSHIYVIVIRFKYRTPYRFLNLPNLSSSNKRFSKSFDIFKRLEIKIKKIKFIVQQSSRRKKGKIYFREKHQYPNKQNHFPSSALFHSTHLIQPSIKSTFARYIRNKPGRRVGRKSFQLERFSLPVKLGLLAKKNISRIRPIAFQGNRRWWQRFDERTSRSRFSPFESLVNIPLQNEVESCGETVEHGNPIRAKRSGPFLFALHRHGHAMQISVVCRACNNFMEIAGPARNFEIQRARVYTLVHKCVDRQSF